MATLNFMESNAVLHVVTLCYNIQERVRTKCGLNKTTTNYKDYLLRDLTTRHHTTADLIALTERPHSSRKDLQCKESHFVLQQEMSPSIKSAVPSVFNPVDRNTHTHTHSQSVLTQTVVSIVGQHESIVAGAPVVARYVDAFVDTASIVVVLTLVHV